MAEPTPRNPPPVRLLDDAVESPAGRVTPADLPDPTPRHRARLIDPPPMIERLWRVALADCEANVVERDYLPVFAATPEADLDVCFAGPLWLNEYFPERVDDTLAQSLGRRLDAGWRVSREFAPLARGVDAPWEVEDCDEAEFARAYGTPPLPRRAGDVARWWAAADLVDRFEWGHDRNAELLDAAGQAFRELYEPLFDRETGLYRGAIDLDGGPIGGPIEGLLRRTTAVNALYVRAFDDLMTAAGRLDRVMEEAVWEKRSEDLREAMGRHLKRPDGTWAAGLDEGGAPLPGRDALGSALVEWLEVPLGPVNDRGHALRGHPISGGMPAVLPVPDAGPAVALPFVESMALRAWHHCTNEPTRKLELALLARTCTPAGTFHGRVDLRTGRPIGPAGHLATAAAFLGAASLEYGLNPG